MQGLPQVAPELAIFGASPRFDDPLHVGRPNTAHCESFLDRVDEMFRCCQLSNGGPLVCEFERRLERFLGVKHCVATCNATTALQLAIRALDLTGEVIVPSFTFVATPHAVSWLGLTPVFCDIDPATHNLDPRQVETHITPSTSAIVPVHLWGRPCDHKRLQCIANAYGLRLIYDAAHAFGVSHRGRRIGQLGDAEVFSFHATKFFNTFEGGAIATNNTTLAARIRQAANFGLSMDAQAEQMGTNAKMPEVSAAMGLTNLEALPRFLKHNRENHAEYVRQLHGISGVSLASYDSVQDANYQYIVIEVAPETAGLNRDELLTVFRAENVIAQRYFHPGCHRMPVYAQDCPQVSLPHTDRVAARVLVLPTGTGVDREQIRSVTNILRTAISHAPAVRQQLAEQSKDKGERIEHAA